MKNIYTAYIKDELTDSLIYKKLAALEKRPENKTLLEKLSKQEQEHYEFWQSLAPEVHVVPNGPFVTLVVWARRLLGVTFTVKFLELHEKDVIEHYRVATKTIPISHRDRLEAIIKDEIGHEASLMSQLKERRISYIGFIALGLADAIVEITGVHAGFLGVTGVTLIAGISGIIVGFAAAISMGSAAYIQAKQDTEKSAIISAFATGISYLVSVVFLALPYFLTDVMIVAFTASTLVGIILIASFTFYGAVVFDRKFIREFAESVFLMLGTAFATFILGTIVGKVFHVGAGSF